MSREKFYYPALKEKHRKEFDELHAEINSDREKIDKPRFSKADLFGALIQNPNKKALVRI